MDIFNKDSEIYTSVVDVEYPDYLQACHKDIPFLPEKSSKYSDLSRSFSGTPLPIQLSYPLSMNFFERL